MVIVPFSGLVVMRAKTLISSKFSRRMEPVLTQVVAKTHYLFKILGFSSCSPIKKKKTHQSHVLNVLHPGTKQGNAYAIAYVLLTCTQVLLTRISCLTWSLHWLTLTIFFLRHTLTRGPSWTWTQGFRTWLTSSVLGSWAIPSHPPWCLASWELPPRPRQFPFRSRWRCRGLGPAAWTFRWASDAFAEVPLLDNMKQYILNHIN